LKQTFLKCRKYKISLNPNKSHFAMEEGKLLGHIGRQDGIRIDPERIKAIQQIEQPRHKKGIQSFMGKINFLRRFIPNLAETSKPISDVLKNDKEGNSFQHIKKVVTEAPVLVSPQFDKDFLTFSFASPHTIVVVLLQKNPDGHEQPISFFSKVLRDVELKYDILEKQAYALMKYSMLWKVGKYTCFWC